jgi:hypothetical protein
VSQPANPGVPPQFRPPTSYGGYGGELQSYGQPARQDSPSGAPAASAAPLPPAPDQQAGAHRATPPDAYSGVTYPGNTYPGNTYPGNTYPGNGYPGITYPGNGYPSNGSAGNSYGSAPPGSAYPASAYDLGQSMSPASATVASRTPQPPQRPATIALAATLASTASLQWIGLLTFCWLVATAGVAQLGTTGVDGGVYHVLSRFSSRMLDGLAWPLYLFPLASFVLSFLLLTRRPWTRLVFSATGAAALLWSAWWLRADLVWWLVPAGYIAVSVLVLWTADAGRWYRWRPASDAAGQSR